MCPQEVDLVCSLELLHVSLGFPLPFSSFLPPSLRHIAIYLPTSSYVVCVWCFMTFKWGITAYLYALPKYIPMATGRYVPISSTVEPV